jgi:hypothetical protein
MIDLGPINTTQGGWTIFQAVACTLLMVSARKFYAKPEMQSSPDAVLSQQLLIVVLGAMFSLTCSFSAFVIAGFVTPNVGWLEVSWVSSAVAIFVGIAACLRVRFWK